MAYDAALAETVSIIAGKDDAIEGYLARPMAPDPVGGVVVIHHLPGYDAASKEITRRFAVMGYNAICPNLYSRDAPGAAPDDAAAAVRAAGGVPDERLVGDVHAAARHLRGLANANGRLGVVGYCSGGRQAFLAACSLPLQAAVDCYGAFVIARPPTESPLQVTPIAHLVPQLSCPLLGLFGVNDKNPSPHEVAELDRLLTDAGREHEFHILEEAGHGFFAVDRPMYAQAAAGRGWQLIADFFASHLSTR